MNRRSLPTFSAALIWLTFAAAVALGGKEFTLWEQVAILRGSNPMDLYYGEHEHFLRYLLVYPEFQLSSATGIHAGQIFNAVCFVCLFGVFLLVRSADKRIAGSTSNWADLAWTIVLCGLAMAMNGRGVLALFGYAILLNTVISAFSDRLPRPWLLIAPFFGLMFCAVSSGVLVAGYLFILLGIGFALLRCRQTGFAGNLYLMIVGTAASSALIFPFALLGVIKNVDFYGGGADGAWQMLNHGLGKIAVLADPLVLVLALPVLGSAYILTAWCARALAPAAAIAGIAILCAMAGGLFGLTTLSVGLVPLLALVRSLCFLPASVCLPGPMPGARRIEPARTERRAPQPHSGC